MKTLLANIEEKESRVMKKCLGTTSITILLLMLGIVLFSTNARAEIFGFNLPEFSSSPKDEEFTQHLILSHPIVPMEGPEQVGENAALAQALKDTKQDPTDETLVHLQKFVNDYPSSRWVPAVQVNRGFLLGYSGYYSRAEKAYLDAWEKGQNETGAVKPLVDRALSELMRFYCGSGKTETAALIMERLAARKPSGEAARQYESLRQTVHEMQMAPEQIFRCGSYSLQRISQFLDPIKTQKIYSTLALVKATKNGLSLAFLQNLALSVSMDMKVAKMDAGAEIPTPAVMHCAFGHYSAILEQKGGLYHISDPLAHSEAWVTRNALEEESTGYFLVGGTLPAGWQEVDSTEAATIWGKGPTNEVPPPAPPCEPPVAGTCPIACATQPPDCKVGMPSHYIDASLAAVILLDTPLYYQTAKGYAPSFRMFYHQKTPKNLPYTNFGSCWRFESFGFIAYNVTCPSYFSNFNMISRGGGSELFTPGGYTQFSKSRIEITKTAAITVSSSGSSSFCNPVIPVEFTRYQPGGYIEVYGKVVTLAGEVHVLLSAYSDPQGNTTSIEYDENNRITTITDADGASSSFTYVSEMHSGDPYNDPFFKVAVITDPHGKTVSFDYDQYGYLYSITDMYGLTTTFKYGAEYAGYKFSSDWLSSMTTPYGTTTFNYAGSQNSGILELEVKDPEGLRKHIKFTAPQNITDPYAGLVPSGVVGDTGWQHYRSTFYWDSAAMETVPAGSIPAYEKATVYHWLHASLNLRSNILETGKKPLENKVWFNYAGQSSGQWSYDGMQPLPVTEGRIIVDSDGTKKTQLKKFTYNSFGQVTSSVDPMGRSVSYVYSPDGIDLLKTIDGDGNILEEKVYNSKHQPLTVIDGSGKRWKYSYDDAGHLLSQTSPLGETTTYIYENNLLKYVNSPQPGSSVTYTYDTSNRIQTKSDAIQGTLTYNYDSGDRLLSIAYPDGTTEEYVYDKLDVKKHKNRDNQTKSYTYDGNQRLRFETDAESRTTVYAWCSCGSLQSITDPKGNKTEWIRDLQGRVTQKIYPDGSSYRYKYEDYGHRLSFITDPKNQIIRFTYAIDDKMISKRYFNVREETSDVHYAYNDPLGRLTSMIDNTGTTSYQYYPFGSTGGGKVKKITQPLGSASVNVSYQYDDDGRVLNRSIDGVEESYDYDPTTGQLLHVTNALGTFGYQYDPVKGHLKYVNYPNGQKTIYDYYTEAQSSRLATIANQDVNNQILSRFNYQYSPNGSITQWAKQLGEGIEPVTMGMTYDRTDQLTGATYGSKGVTFSYDTAGNRLREEKYNEFVNTFGVNNLNQLTDITRDPIPVKGYTNRLSAVTVNGLFASEDGSQGFEAKVPLASGSSTPLTITAVAPDGTVKVEKKKVKNSVAYIYDANGNLVNDGEKNYTWDAADRLIRVNLLNTMPMTMADTVEFKYNGLGQRVGIIEKHGDTVLSNKTYFWVGAWIAEERDSTGSTVAKRYFGNGFQIASGDNQGSYFYSEDHLGSIREVSNVAGIVVAKYDYDLWGRQTKLNGTMDADFGFTAFYVNSSTGLDLTWYRAYNPEMGRWLSRDPLAESSGNNLYASVDNNPVFYVDPLGLKKCVGLARILAGNPKLIGKQGGIPGVKVAANTAAVIPGQWGGNSKIRPNACNISGKFDGGSFSGVSDVVGGKSPTPGKNVRDSLQELYPGQLIIELPSLPPDKDPGDNVKIELTIPDCMNCPTGTKEEK